MLRRTPWLLALALVAFCTAALAASDSAESGDQVVREIALTATRYRFTPSQIEVNKGDTVRLTIRAHDVTHGFGIPDLGVDVVVDPDVDPVTVEFVADTPGRYRFACTFVCGNGHGDMQGVLTVLPTGEQPSGARPDRVDDLTVDVVEPEFSVMALPTTLRLPRNRFAFRLTHRFSRPLDGGPGNGNLLEDFFGFDSAALIGLELRYGVAPGAQVGVYRNNNRNIQIFGRYNILWQGKKPGIGLDAFVAVEGSDNFREEYSPTLGVVFSQRIRDRAAVYVEPLWVGNANKPGLFHPQPTLPGDDSDTFMVGLGARLRVLETVYVVAEYVPRVKGFDQGADHISVGFEKRVGGHIFQLNISNSLGVTPVQLAQGGDLHDWFIGFNIARKLY